MAKIGDILKGKEVGINSNNKHIYACCTECEQPRWTLLSVSTGMPVRPLCRKCAGLKRRGEKRGASHNRLDLLGKRFTRLLVVKFSGVKEGRRESLWECLCDCGNTAIIPAGQLRSGQTKSCGCYHKIRTRELFSLPKKEVTLGRVLCDYRRKAKSRGFAFSLTRGDFGNLIFSSCYYCGSPPENNLRQHGERLLYQGIDRKDNDKGYTLDNVVPCCKTCNLMKKALSHDEFLAHIHKIAAEHVRPTFFADWEEDAPYSFSAEDCSFTVSV